MTGDLPDNFDPMTFLDDLVFTDEVVEDVPRLEPGEKIIMRRTLNMSWDGQVDWRVRRIAEARGMSMEDLIEEWAELEIARVDALQALDESRHRGTAA